jgi:hypothetical protein
MRNRKHNSNRSEQKLVCPACGKQVERIFGSQPEPQSPLVPQIGQVTNCDHCLTMLEYIPVGTSLALRVAPQQRVDAFHKLATNTMRGPRLAELIDYVKRYRAMPTKLPWNQAPSFPIKGQKR